MNARCFCKTGSSPLGRAGVLSASRSLISLSFLVCTEFGLTLHAVRGRPENALNRSLFDLARSSTSNRQALLIPARFEPV